MQIRLEEHTIREIINGYVDSAENGVVGFGGKLNIRPAFQREFVYKEKERNAVIETVMKNFPLNVMYWVEDENGNYELLDGQQRTLSICEYCIGNFSVKVDGNPKIFSGLTETERNQILNYKLMIYICNGNDKEKLDWFKIINIAGVQLKPQELRNAIYTGTWLTDAKKFFSKNGCAAYQVASKYLSGEANRQEYLETAIKWIADAEDAKSIEDYMSQHQHDESAMKLWVYFQSVISWVQTAFPHYRKEMKGLEWGLLYNRHKNDNLNPAALEQRIVELMQDDDVTSRKGIYEYLLTGEEKHLNIRKFSDTMKRQAYERQNGICPNCKKHFEIDQMEGDHITPWHIGGKTSSDNCQMLCKECNRRKSGI